MAVRTRRHRTPELCPELGAGIALISRFTHGTISLSGRGGLFYNPVRSTLSERQRERSSTMLQVGSPKRSVGDRSIILRFPEFARSSERGDIFHRPCAQARGFPRTVAQPDGAAVGEQPWCEGWKGEQMQVVAARWSVVQSSACSCVRL